ncbi:MAG: zinc dependent phospholipase C family protein [Bacteroidota bacterium]
MSRFLKLLCCVLCLLVFGGWGFFAHRKINRLAVFTLPPAMMPFYKRHIAYLEETSVNPDRRRYAVPDEAARHYIDLDAYGDSAAYRLPRYWRDALAQWSEDTLQARGILPWHIHRVYLQLREAFLLRDPARVLRISAELGHYVADAHVPLHTTSNYDGHKTGQHGLHGFWESRLPELFFGEYDFLVGKATYIEHVQVHAWQAVTTSAAAVDSVLALEKELSRTQGDRKYAFETKGRQTVKVFSTGYSRAYHQVLNGMVERQMRASVKMIGDLWFSAWVDAGQPDLSDWHKYQPTEEELKARKEELERWRAANLPTRDHEKENR